MASRVVLHENIKSLRRAGKALYDKKVPWADIAEELGIFTPRGTLNPGLAYRIVMEDYEPKRPETRARLGLVGMCPYCKRKVGERRKRKDLFSTSTKELKWMFENRQEIGCSSDAGTAQEDVTDSPNGMESMAV